MATADLLREPAHVELGFSSRELVAKAGADPIAWGGCVRLAKAVALFQ